MSLIEEKIKEIQEKNKNILYNTWLLLYVKGINDELLKDDWRGYIDSFAQVFYNAGRKDQQNYYTCNIYILQDNIPSPVIDRFKNYLIIYKLLGYGEV